jgi:hypothetical protein
MLTIVNRSRIATLTNDREATLEGEGKVPDRRN